MSNKTIYEIFAGYHENIAALKGELAECFNSWQKYGEFTAEQVADFMETTENGLIYTAKAYAQLKNILDLPNEEEEEAKQFIFSLKGEF